MRRYSGFIRLMCSGVLTGAVAGLLSCAHQVNPSGGPLDTTPPRVLTSVPANAAVRHLPAQGITLNFSEWIDPVSAERCVSFFPPPAKGIRVTVRGKMMKVQPIAALEDSTTYHVEINATLKDIRGNTIGTPHQLVFSTGDVLDSGKISGCVVDPQNRAGQPKVALFRSVADSLADSILFGIPSYLTQTDSAGIFLLQYVRPGQYEIVGFTDRNGDNRLQPGEGEVFSALDPRLQVSAIETRVELFPSACDTAVSKVKSIIAQSPRVVIGTWTKSPLTPAERTRWRIQATDSGQAPGILAITPVKRSERFAVALDRDLRRTGYQLVYPRRSASEGRELLDTIRFNGITIADTARPKITVRRTSGEATLRPEIVLGFSEPTRCRFASWEVFDSLGDTVRMTTDTGFADTVVFSPVRRFTPGRTYRFAMPLSACVDMANNPAAPVDTTDSVSVVFRVIEFDKICVSMRGSATCAQSAEGGSRLTWRFTPFAGGPPSYTPDSAGTFRFDSIPAAKGQVLLFDDRDGDGKPTAGTLFSWKAPERFFPFVDTVEARARWDVSGIDLSACNPCTRTVPLPTAATRPAEQKRPASNRGAVMPSIPAF